MEMQSHAGYSRWFPAPPQQRARLALLRQFPSAFQPSDKDEIGKLLDEYFFTRPFTDSQSALYYLKICSLANVECPVEPTFNLNSKHARILGNVRVTFKNVDRIFSALNPDEHLEKFLEVFSALHAQIEGGSAKFFRWLADCRTRPAFLELEYARCVYQRLPGLGRFFVSINLKTALEFFERACTRNPHLALYLLLHIDDQEFVCRCLDEFSSGFVGEFEYKDLLYFLLNRASASYAFKNELFQAMASFDVSLLKALLSSRNDAIGKYAMRKLMGLCATPLEHTTYSKSQIMEIVHSDHPCKKEMLGKVRGLDGYLGICVAASSDRLHEVKICNMEPQPSDPIWFILKYGIVKALKEFSAQPEALLSQVLVPQFFKLLNLLPKRLQSTILADVRGIDGKALDFLISKIDASRAFILRSLSPPDSYSIHYLNLVVLEGMALRPKSLASLYESLCTSLSVEGAASIFSLVAASPEEEHTFAEYTFLGLKGLLEELFASSVFDELSPSERAAAFEQGHLEVPKKPAAAKRSDELLIARVLRINASLDKRKVAIEKVRRLFRVCGKFICNDARIVPIVWRLLNGPSDAKSLVPDIAAFASVNGDGMFLLSSRSKLPPSVLTIVSVPLIVNRIVTRADVEDAELLCSLLEAKSFAIEEDLVLPLLTALLGNSSTFGHAALSLSKLVSKMTFCASFEAQLQQFLAPFILCSSFETRVASLEVLANKAVVEPELKALLFIYHQSQCPSKDVENCPPTDVIIKVLCAQTTSEEYAEAITRVLQLSFNDDIAGKFIELVVEAFVALLKNRFPAIIRGSNLPDLTEWKRAVLVRSLLNVKLSRPLAERVLSLSFEHFLKDPSELIRDAAFSACAHALHSDMSPFLFKMLDRFEKDDTIRIYMFSLLSYVVKDPREIEKMITENLAPSLLNPSESIQKAVSEALSRLPLTSAKELTDGFCVNLFKKNMPLSSRRGYAYGFAAIIQHFDILVESFSKSSANSKIGAILLTGILAAKLTKSFEPWSIKLFPIVLRYVADSNIETRTAAASCLDVIIRHTLSSLGFRTILPFLITELDEESSLHMPDIAVPDSSWRSKEAAAKILGELPYYISSSSASACFPVIVNALVTTICSHPHAEVQSAARSALQRYSSSIKVPEIKAFSHVIIDSICDPSSLKKAYVALTAVSEVTYGHIIDSTSVALLLPLITKSLTRKDKDDSVASLTSIKKMACIIVGNIVSKLIDPAQFLSFQAPILSGLLFSSIDATPESRHAASKAIAAIVRSCSSRDCGDAIQFKEMFEGPSERIGVSVESLLSHLTSKLCSNLALERQGAAQVLSEILAVKGPVVTNMFLSNYTLVNEGLMAVYFFLPLAYEVNHAPCSELYAVCKFEQYIPKMIETASDPAISDHVKDMAGRAARQLVIRHCNVIGLEVIFDLLMSSRTLTAANRLFTLQLLLDLLKRLIPDDKFGIGCEFLQSAGLLSRRTLQRILSQVFLARNESSNDDEHGSGTGPLRAVATAIWKMLISHSPRALLDIYPVLCDDLLKSASARPFTCRASILELIDRMGDRLLEPFIDRLLLLSHEDPVNSLRLVMWLCEHPTLQMNSSGSFSLPQSLVERITPKFLSLLSIGMEHKESVEISAKIFTSIQPIVQNDSSAKELIMKLDEKSLSALMTHGGPVFAETIIQLNKFNSGIIEKCPQDVLAKNIPRLYEILDDACLEVLIRRMCLIDVVELTPLNRLLDLMRKSSDPDRYLLTIGNIFNADFMRISWNAIVGVWDEWSQAIQNSAVLLRLFTPAALGANNVLLSRVETMPKLISVSDSAHFSKCILITLLNTGEACTASKLLHDMGTCEWDAAGLSLLVGSLIRVYASKRDENCIAALECILEGTGRHLIKAFYPQILRILKSSKDSVYARCLGHLIALLNPKSRTELLSELDLKEYSVSLKIAYARLGGNEAKELRNFVLEKINIDIN